jgi:hypothetical protein
VALRTYAVGAIIETVIHFHPGTDMVRTIDLVALGAVTIETFLHVDILLDIIMDLRDGVTYIITNKMESSYNSLILFIDKCRICKG